MSNSKYELSIRTDGRLSIEHQLSIHVNDLVDAFQDDHPAEISLMEVLQGIKYVMDYRIKGNKQPSLDKEMMKKLCDGLLIPMRWKERGVLRPRTTPESDLAFQLFIEWLVEVQEFREIVAAIPPVDLSHALKIHRRIRHAEQRLMLVTMLVTLTSYLPQHFNVSELVRPDALKNVEQAIEELGPAVERQIEMQKKSRPANKASAKGLFPPPALYSDRRIKRVVDMFGTNPTSGLTSSRVAELQEHYGQNILPAAKQTSPLKMFITQITDFMVIILILAAVLSAAFGEVKSAVVLLIVVFMNVIIGFIQELKASNALSALMSLTVPQTTVIRDDQKQTLDSQLLVPGDIVVLEEGDAVPADLRLVETSHLEVIESILTGESLPVTKSTDEIRTRTRQLPLGDCKGNAFMGTTVARGRGIGIVVRIGDTTEIGKISSAIVNQKDVKTPMQIRLARLGIILVALSVLMCALVVIIGLARQLEVYKMVKLGISLAVSVIPEGLVAVTTITMAIGVRRMAAQNAIIRKLAGVESLGGVSTICSDKTGTLTEGKMTASELWIPADQTSVVGSGIGFTQGAELLDGVAFFKVDIQETIVDPKRFKPEDVKQLGKNTEKCDSAFAFAMMICSLCNNSSLSKEEDGSWKFIGDFTEIAMLVASIKAGMDKVFWEKSLTKLSENAFDSDRKLMSVIYRKATEIPFILAKGAPEAILHRCSSRIVGGTQLNHDYTCQGVSLDDAFRKIVAQQSSRMASSGLRVLGLAMRSFSTAQEAQSVVDSQSIEITECNMTFVGLIGLIDPPRKGVKESIEKCHQAGIKVVMITGDHIVTAKAIATNLGILDPSDPQNSRAMKGDEIDLLSDEALKYLTPFPNVFARVSPDNKLHIVQALQAQGQSVAMTGDGVNDAPAIKAASVGIAMGQTGTEITKQAADVILSDDNFSTIVKAVKEGRRVFDNVQKFVIYLLSCNFAEILIILLALIIGIEPPFTPMMILFANIVADVPPSMSIGIEPAEQDVMNRPPKDPSRGVLTLSSGFLIMAQSLTMGLLGLGVYLWDLSQSGNLQFGAFTEDRRAQTHTFVALTILQLQQSFLSRSVETSVFKTGVTANKYMVFAFLLSFTLLIMAVFIPGVNTFFDLTPISSWQEWLVILIAVVIHIAMSELLKICIRNAQSAKSFLPKRVFSREDIIVTN